MKRSVVQEKIQDCTQPQGEDSISIAISIATPMMAQKPFQPIVAEELYAICRIQIRDS